MSLRQRFKSFTFLHHIASSIGMALHKLERRNYGRKSLVSIKYQNLRTFKEGLILLCQSSLKTRRITHLHDSTHFTILLILHQWIKFHFHTVFRSDDIKQNLLLSSYLDN